MFLELNFPSLLGYYTVDCLNIFGSVSCLMYSGINLVHFNVLKVNGTFGSCFWNVSHTSKQLQYSSLKKSNISLYLSLGWREIHLSSLNTWLLETDNVLTASMYVNKNLWSKKKNEKLQIIPRLNLKANFFLTFGEEGYSFFHSMWMLYTSHWYRTETCLKNVRTFCPIYF